MTTHHNTQSLQGNNHNGNKAITLDDIRSALMNEFHFSTSLKEPEQFRFSQRAQHIYDITQQDFDWFITLTFRYKKTDHDEVVLLGKKFFDLLSGEIYGRRSKNRIIHYSAICWRRCNTDPPVGVNLTHLGNDGGFLATDNVDSGASSGDQGNGAS